MSSREDGFSWPDLMSLELAYQKRLLTCLSSVQENQFLGFGKTSFVKGWPHHTIERLIFFFWGQKVIYQMGSVHTIELQFVLLLVLRVRERLGVHVVFIWSDILRNVSPCVSVNDSVCNGELGTSYLVQHFVECAPCFSVNWEFIFLGNFTLIISFCLSESELAIRGRAIAQ